MDSAQTRLARIAEYLRDLGDKVANEDAEFIEEIARNGLLPPNDSDNENGIPYSDCEECQKLYQDIYDLSAKLAQLRNKQDQLWNEHGHN